MEHATPRFNMGYIYPNQTQKEFLINEALLRIDSLMLPCVESRTLKTPPPDPHLHHGEIYIVPEAADSAWSWVGGVQHLVVAASGNWVWIKPRKGMFLWVCDEMRPCVYDGSSWRALKVSYVDGLFGF